MVNDPIQHKSQHDILTSSRRLCKAHTDRSFIVDKNAIVNVLRQSEKKCSIYIPKLPMHFEYLYIEMTVDKCADSVYFLVYNTAMKRNICVR